MSFVLNYMSFPFAPMRSCVLPGFPVCYRVFYMNPNWPQLEIICQSCAILCIRYGLESSFFVDSPILFALNVIASNQPYSDVRYSHKSALECPIVFL